MSPQEAGSLRWFFSLTLLCFALTPALQQKKGKIKMCHNSQGNSLPPIQQTPVKSSGEEVSVSLGYALRTTDRLTPPIHASKTEAPTKTRWIPKMKNLGINQRKIPGWKKEMDQNRAKSNPKMLGRKCHIMSDGTKPCRPQSN